MKKLITPCGNQVELSISMRTKVKHQVTTVIKFLIIAESVFEMSFKSDCNLIKTLNRRKIYFPVELES
jgi:hypothetical protein